MQTPWHEGDVAATICNSCGRQVNARYEARDIKSNRSAMVFSQVLVGVCSECDSLVSLPRQSMAQILELSYWK